MSKTLKKATLWLGFAVLVGVVVTARPLRAEEPEAPRKVTKKVAPVFPEIAKQARLTGTVKLALVVTPEGDVKSVRTLGGNAVFVPAAEEAAKKWKFEASKKESTEAIAIAFGAQ